MDLQSKTGTWMKDARGKEERVAFRTLQPGEQFRVSNFWVRWEEAPPGYDDYPEGAVG